MSLDFSFLGLILPVLLLSFMIFGLFFAGWVAGKCCPTLDSDEWDADADGEIDRDEFMRKQQEAQDSMWGIKFEPLAA